jgi:uncharacterized protein with NRDE domain
VCTIVFAWRHFADAPLVLAANRDELVTRPSDPPHLLQPDPPLWGGRDRFAGGTWLAVDPRGRVAAVTNRHPGGRVPGRDPRRRSRGDLPTALLSGRSDADARTLLGSLTPADYNPVNLLFLSPTAATWMGMDDEGLTARDLAPGIHVLTEQDPDDPTSPKAVRLLEAATTAGARAADAATLLDGFRALLRSHATDGGGPEAAACIHEDSYGTVSSATVLVASRQVHFDHADGHPCATPYRPVSMVEPRTGRDTAHPGG